MPSLQDSTVERQFYEHLVSLGIAPLSEAEIRSDGRKHRYRIEGDKAREKNGEYCLYGDDRPAGWCKSYSAKHGVEYSVWTSGTESKVDFNAAYFEERARRHEERTLAERKKREFTAKTALKAIEAMTPPKTDHPYLRAKGITCPLPDGIGQIGSDLVVPLKDAQGQIWNRQSISPSGEKLFLAGRKMGCFFEIDGEGPHVYVVEGLATGITVHEATGSTVIVAFDAGNLRPVAESLQSRFAGRLAVAADNDRKTYGNPGMKAALALAEEFGIPMVCPPFSGEEKGTDWNDYAALHGIERTAAEIGRQMDAWMADLEKRSAWVTWADVDGKGAPLRTSGNVKILLRHMGCRIWYDTVKKQPRYEIPGVTFASDNRENAFLSYLLSESYRHGFGVGKQLLDLFLFEIQDTCRRNPVKEWITAKGWDGRSRFRDLADSLVLDGGFDPSFRDLLLRKWLLSCVVAAFAPDEENCQFRGVLVLQGDQAIGKSLWLRSLVPAECDWFLGGLTLDTRDKDSVIKAISHWIVELGELDATFKAQDISRLKQFITQSDDTLRLPYAPKPSTYKRRTVYCGSVNTPYFLNDNTGNTRWWTLPVRECRFDHAIDMQQLWAEVYRWHLEGEQHWLDREETLRLERANQDNTKSDPVEDAISRTFDWDNYDQLVVTGRCEWMTATEVLLKCQGMDRPTRQQVDVATQVLRKLTGRPSERKGKAGSRCFYVPEEIQTGGMAYPYFR